MTKPPMPKARNKDAHPHYFGTYLNMARHNAYMILTYLSSKYTGKAGDDDDAQLAQSPVLTLLLKSKKPDEVYAIIGDLRHYFPFLRYQDVLNEKEKGAVSADAVLDLAVMMRGGSVPKKEVKPAELQPEAYAQLLKNLLILMNSLRNAFSHYNAPPQYKCEKTDVLFAIYDAALYRLIDKNKQTKRYDYFEPAHIAPLERTKDAIKAKRVPHTISPTAIDEKSLAYFICLFLEPKYASMFLSRLAGFQKALSEDKLSLLEKAPLKAYTMFCCRLPQPKLESSDIMLDMLNELNRCPSDLYPVLSEEDKTRRFKVILNADDLNQAVKTDENDEYTEGSPQEVVLKRHDDRFPYFALRYFDDTGAFPRLRFHVQLGKLLKKSKYPKVMFGENRERTLTQPIFAFTKLKPMLQKYEAVNQDDLENKKIDPRYVSAFNFTWKEQKGDDTQLRDSIEQFSPHYNFGEQTIGFKIFDAKMDMRSIDNDLPKLPVHASQDKLKGTEPDAFISTYELRNLFFYQYLYKKNRIELSAEDFLLDYFKNIKRFFKDVKDGTFRLDVPPDFTKNEKKPFVKGNPKKTKELTAEYNNLQKDMAFRRDMLTEQVKLKYSIGYTSIPHDIREYLLGYKTPQYGEHVVKKLTLQIKDVKQRLKDIGKPIVDASKPPPPVKTKTGIEKDRSPRVGEQATWLAEDILHFMPTRKHTVNGKDHDQKMNNDQFRILQSSLAYFSSNKTQIWDYFKELGLIHGEKALQHPFLHKIDKSKCDISLDFYELYLKAKYKFLTAIILDITKEGADGKTIYAPQKFIEDHYSAFIPPPEKKGMEKSYVNVPQLSGKDVPVLLPKGLFNEAISMALNVGKKKSYKNDINTVVYSLENYSEIKGDTQDFYGYEHHYQMPRMGENTEGVFKLKSDYVADLEAKIIELDKQKEAAEKKKSTTNPKANTKEKALEAQKAQEKKDKIQKFKDDLRDTHRQKERILTREQTIRYHQANDRAVWLMVKDRQENAEEHFELNLKELKLENLETVLDLPIKVKGKVPRNNAAIVPISDVQIVEELPIRRYGDLRRVLKDRRLANLVAYYHPHQEIEHETIKNEFLTYDLERVRFFEDIYKFEEAIFNAFKTEFPPMINGEYDDKAFMSKYGIVVEERDKMKKYYPHHVFLRIATDHLTDKDGAAHYNVNVIQLRNKFLHNQIPYFDWLTDEVQNEATPLMCDKIFVVAKRYYKNLRKMVIDITQA